MRRAIIALGVVALAFFAAPAAAEQGSWQPRLTLYSGQFYSVAFASATTVWAAGPGGVLLSEDGGASWRWALNAPIGALEPAGDGAHGWAVGPGGAIFATSDGGRSWVGQRSGTSLDLYAVSVFDSQRAIAMGVTPQGDTPRSFSPNVVLRTADGGATWTAVQFPEKLQLGSLAVVRGGSKAWLSATKCNPNANAPNGCTFGDSVLLVSEDSGQTWKETAGPTLREAHFVDDSTGWALQQSALLRTTDGGRTWRKVREWPATGPYGRSPSVFGNAGAAIIEDSSNGNSQIIETTNGGRTWSNAGPPQTGLGVVTFFDKDHVVKTGSTSPLSWSEDGGVTWHVGRTPLFVGNSVFDFVGSTGWVSASKLLRTSNGGLSWQAVSDIQPAALDFVSSSEGWAIETQCQNYPCSSTILHSVDGGVTWEKQTTFSAGYGLSLTFVDSANGWVEQLGASQGPLLHTRDGGKTWRSQYVPGPSVDFVSASAVWAAGSNSSVGGDAQHAFVSLDGGDTWSQAGDLQAQGTMTLTGFDASHAWAVSEEYIPGLDGEQLPPFTLYRTVDGGKTWEQLGDRSQDRFTYLKFFSPSDGIAIRQVCPEAGTGDCRYELRRTFDGGLTWNVERIDADYGLAYDFLDMWHGWGLHSEGIYQSTIATLRSYSATPPVVMPGTGEGPSGSPNAVPAVLGLLGALLGLGGFALHRRRQQTC